MHLDISGDANPSLAAAEVSDERQRIYLAIGFFCSVILHGLILPLFLSTPDRTATPPDVPMDVVVVADVTASPSQPVKAAAPQQQAGLESLPAAEPIGAKPSTERPDDLEMKLHALAKLRQPSLDTHLAEKSLGLSRLSATSNEAIAGPYATYAVRDIIRAQVERRWGLDLAALRNSNLSISIRVEITSAGIVTKAEITDIARFKSDKVYREAASSARNAVLLSSPLALPPGHYGEIMEVIISLNTSEALR